MRERMCCILTAKDFNPWKYHELVVIKAQGKNAVSRHVASLVFFFLIHKIRSQLSLMTCCKMLCSHAATRSNEATKVKVAQLCFDYLANEAM